MSAKTRAVFCVRLAVTGFFLLFFPPAALHAETTADLKKLESEMAAQKAKDAALAQQQKKVATSLETLQQQLVEATAALQDQETAAEALDDRLAELDAASEAKEKTLRDARQRLTLMATTMLRLARVPPEALLISDGFAARATIDRRILLRSLIPQLHDEAAQRAHELEELAQLQAATAEQRRLVAATRQNLAWQRRNLDALVAARQGVLQKTAAARSELARQLATLGVEAQDLRQLLQKVNQASPWPKGKDKIISGKSLRMPVAGRTLRGFGARDADGVVSQGLTLAAPAGSPIVAPRAGRVVFTGPFRGYGQIVILQHDGNTHSFMAGFGRIDAEMGQDVATGEPLGALPDNAARAELYFEYRRKGEPVDPAG